MSTGAYPFWSDEELARLRAGAIEIVVRRYETRRGDFVEIQRDCESLITELFERTDFLRELGRSEDVLASNQDLLNAARYLTAPTVSAGTLELIATDVSKAETIDRYLDRDRFPWLDSNQQVELSDPTVRAAIKISATVWTEQRVATKARTESSRKQEHLVRDALGSAGLTYVEPKTIRERISEFGDSPAEGLMPKNYQEALKRGEFTREIRVAGSKCDVPARLPNGKLLPIECKVSNTEVNSVKRLLRETGGKHSRWRAAFGELNTGAVLGGAFKLLNLQQAQREGMLIFFDHDLDSLKRYVAAGGEPRPLRA